MLIKEIAFTAIPGESSPSVLLMFYQEHLLHGIQIYLKKFSETFRLDLSCLTENIVTIDCEKRFSPALFGIYSQMKSSYEKNALESFFHALQDLKNLLKEGVYATECTFSSFLSESWEKDIICDLKNSAPGPIESKTLFPLIHWNQADFPPKDLQEALLLLEKLDQDLYQEYATYVSRFKFFSSKLIIACTSAKFFGTIYMRPPQPTENALYHYLENLAHEVSHLHLYAMMGADSMVLNKPDELFSSPLRPDLRPMYGIFHACFVLARIIRVLRRCERAGGQIRDQLQKKEARFHEACAVVKTSAHLTESGKQLYQTLESCAFEN